MDLTRNSHDRAFVLGGGGVLGAHEVGMLQALAEAGIAPDLVLGTSIGALNGAVFAAEPTVAGVERLIALWRGFGGGGPFGISMLRQVATLLRSRTHLVSLGAARERLEQVLPVGQVEQLAVSFQCVAASIEHAAEHWFTAGPLADVVLASCAVPGVLPPVRIGDQHFIDGGIVNSIPVSRAVALGAREIYVLQVGRAERALCAPRWPWEVGLVAFEVARRHRFAHDLRSLPEHVRLHVMPTGGSSAPAYNDFRGQLDIGRLLRTIAHQIDTAHDASARYLEELGCRQPGSGDRSPSASG